MKVKILKNILERPQHEPLRLLLEGITVYRSHVIDLRWSRCIWGAVDGSSKRERERGRERERKAKWRRVSRWSVEDEGHLRIPLHKK